MVDLALDDGATTAAIAAYNGGCAALALGQNADAAEHFSQALRLSPDWPRAWGNLGVAMFSDGAWDDAGCAFRIATALRPAWADAWFNLGQAEEQRRDYLAAVTAFEQALLSGYPDLVRLRRRIFLCCFMGADRSPAYTQALARSWADDVRRSVPAPRRRLPEAGLATRPLRWGLFVATPARADIALSVRCALPGLTTAGAQVTLYLDQPAAALYQDLDVTLREVGAADDAALAAMIEQDRIDVLATMDFVAMGPRAGLFARRPAPMAINYSHAFFSFGGVLFDGLAMDPVVFPPGVDDAYPEDLLRLSLCSVFDPAALAGRPPLVAPPCADGRAPCFSSFNRPNKIDAATAEFWGTVMAAVPNATLFLSNEAFELPHARERALSLLAAVGVGPERLRIRGDAATDGEFLSGYNQVDLALDTVNFSGGLTTLDALWQGVPTITAPPAHPLGRVSAAFMVSLGLEDLCVASSPADGAAKAAALVGDKDRLRALRADLRNRAAASPLFDGNRFAADLLAQTRAWLLQRHPEAA